MLDYPIHQDYECFIPVKDQNEICKEIWERREVSLRHYMRLMIKAKKDGDTEKECMYLSSICSLLRMEKPNEQ